LQTAASIVDERRPKTDLLIVEIGQVDIITLE